MFRGENISGKPKKNILEKRMVWEEFKFNK